MQHCEPLLTLNKEIIREVIVENKDEDGPISINEEKLTEIHARAVNKLTQETQGEINYKDEQVDSDITKRVSELDGLIG